MGTGGEGEENPEKDGMKTTAWGGVRGSQTAGKCTDLITKSCWRAAAPIIWAAKCIPPGAAPEDGFGEGEALVREAKYCESTRRYSSSQ